MLQVTKKSKVELLMPVPRELPVPQASRIKHPPIITAAMEGDIETVELLIENGVDIDGDDEVDIFNYTPLNQACYYGHVDLVELLLKKGANPNYTSNDKQNNFPINYAIENEKQIAEKVLKLLFRYGAKLTSGYWLIYHENVGALKIAFQTSYLSNVSSPLNLLLIAREKDIDSPLHKNNFPLDLFKLIYNDIKSYHQNEAWDALYDTCHNF